MYNEISFFSLKEQILFNKLVSFSEYFVTQNALNEDLFPNKISRTNKILYLEEKNIGEELNINLTVSFYPEKNKTCIYRLVVFNDEIKKLFFCGG